MERTVVVSKYSIAKATLEETERQAQANEFDVGETLEALIVLAIERSVKVRGAKTTKQSLVFEVSNIAGEVDFDFVRSR